MKEKRRLLDQWWIYAILCVVFIVAGYTTYSDLVDYENGKKIFLSRRIFTLYKMTGKAGVLAVIFALSSLMAWGAWYKYRKFKNT